MRSPSERGVLIVNLGSPDRPDAPSVRRYLRQFLMDPRVLDLPYLLRLLVVEGFILPFRPARTAQAYRFIWTGEGSPLVVHTRRLAAALGDRLPMPVEAAMRYGHPSIASGIQRLMQRQPAMDEVLLIPLYPHYAMATFETVTAETRRVLKKTGCAARLTVQPPFYADPSYIRALVERAGPYLAQSYDHLLFSFHGIPERHCRKTDPTGRHCLRTPDCCQVPSPAHETCYRRQAFCTVRAFVEAAGIPEGRYSVAFQSRLGRDAWLKPFTSEELVRLARAGVRRLAVQCPSFTADCLETLEEIGLRGQEAFCAAGGDSLTLIPCLNDHPRWVEAVAGWCVGQG